MGKKRKRKDNFYNKNPKRQRRWPKPEESKENLLKCLPTLAQKLVVYGKVRQNTCLEAELGMQEYISKTDGFTGKIKHRYEDFVVQEVNRDGDIASVTNEDALTDDEKPSNIEFSDEDVKKCAEFASVPEAENLQEFFLTTKLGNRKARFNMHLCQVGEKAKHQGNTLSITTLSRAHVTLEGDISVEHSKLIPHFEGEAALKGYKGRRTQVHKWLNTRFPRCTHKTDEFGRVEVSRKLMRARDKRWPRNKPPTLKFVVSKTGMSTSQALKNLARELKIKEKNFGFAGNKDKRGVTSQWVTVSKVPSSRVRKAALSQDAITVGNFKYTSQEEFMGLGALSGNRFIITVRDVTGKVEDMTKALFSIAANGFINYFGSQRFGVSSIGTHELGKCALRQNWAQLCALLLVVQPSFHEDVKAKLLEFWKTGDLSLLSFRAVGMGFEVARYLGHSPGKYRDAVNSDFSQL